MEPEPPDTVRSRTGGRSARLREQVLGAARQVIAAEGYDALTHRRVAHDSGVAQSTIYRRWPTRQALAADALRSTSVALELPDTGHLPSDLEALVNGLAARLANAEVRRTMLTHALAVQEQPDLLEAGRRFWEETFQQAAVIVRRAQARGELDADSQGETMLERLVAPVVFRALISGAPIDAPFLASCLATSPAPPAHPLLESS